MSKDELDRMAKGKLFYKMDPNEKRHYHQV